MSIFQGKVLKTIIEKIQPINEINTFFNSKSSDETESKKKEKLDELLNYIKLKEHLLQNNYKSFHLKIAPNTYYTWTLGEIKRAKTKISESPFN